MFNLRRTLALLTMSLAFAFAARASTSGNAPPADLADAAVRQAEMKRQFVVFKEKLILLAGRMEASTKADDRERAKSLRKAIQVINAREIDGKFDSILRGLRTPGADKDIDLLTRVLKDNKELREDLKGLVALMIAGPAPEDQRDRAEKIEKLRDQLKELRSKQARLQALAEMGRHVPAELRKAQEKITGPTRKIEARGVDRDASVEKQVRARIEEARQRMEDAEGKLGRGNRPGAGDDMGRAVTNLDSAIRKLDDLLRQLRKEEMERVLTDLQQRCERMLQIQIEVRDGTVALRADVEKSSTKQPTTAQRGKANGLADREGLIAKEVEGALKVLEGEGSAVAFRETFEQLLKDARAVQNRLNSANTDKVTLTIENEIIETLQEMIAALKKQIRTPEPTPPGPGEPGPRPPEGKRPLLELLAELKMVYSLQRRVNARTELYGKEYAGEQLAPPSGTATRQDRERYEMIRRELRDLAGSQKKIGGVTRSLGIAVASGEPR